MSVAGDYIGRVRLGVTIGVAGSQSFTWPDGRPTGTYTADAGPDGTIPLEVTEVGDDTITVAWAGGSSRRMIGHPWRVLRDGAWLFGDLYVTEAEPSDDDPADFTVLDGVVEVTVNMVAPGGGGVTDHGDLNGRNEPGQHSTDAVTVPDGTMAFVEAYYPPASDGLTDHLGSIDDAFVGAAQAIVAVGAASIGTSQKGAPNGVAELDGSGLVLSSQLPSYVDDVIVVADYAALPGTGADGKIYVTSDTNLTYRWTGSAYVEISKSLALGTTSSTAHRGDLGSTAYTHSQATGNPHGTTAGDLGVLRPGGPAFHAAASSAAMTALSAVRGDVCFRSDLDSTLYVLTSNTPTNLGDWTVLRFNSSTPIFPSSFTAKGDLLVATGAGTFAAVPRGADGTVLKAKTSETPGVEWGDAVDTATLAKIGTTVEAASDTAARTSTTAVADGVLEFTAAADTSYRIDAYLIFQGDATADLKVGFTIPTGTIHATVEGGLTTVASGSDYDRFFTLTSSGQTAAAGIAGASTPISVRVTGVIRPTSAGTVALVWAPNAAGAGTGVTRLARSQIYYRAV